MRKLFFIPLLVLLACGTSDYPKAIDNDILGRWTAIGYQPVNGDYQEIAKGDGSLDYEFLKNGEIVLYFNDNGEVYQYPIEWISDTELRINSEPKTIVIESQGRNTLSLSSKNHLGDIFQTINYARY